MLDAKNLSFQYRRSGPLLQDISLECKPGELLGLLGHNGSGKTTLLRILGGLLPPEIGSVLWGGISVENWKRSELYNRIGLMIEEPAFYPQLTLYENLRIITHYRKLSRSRIGDCLERVGASDFGHRKARELSTGMRQRGALAAVLLHDPEWILLDEPTNGMDPEGIIQIRKLLEELKEEGRTLIVSSHLLSEIEKVGDKLMILQQGKVLFMGSKEEIAGEYRDLEELYVQRYTGNND